MKQDLDLQQSIFVMSIHREFSDKIVKSIVDIYDMEYSWKIYDL